MRLPWGEFKRIGELFLFDKKPLILGCLSFEERCLGIANLWIDMRMQHADIRLIRIKDPINCLPDYSNEIEKKTKKNEQTLKNKGIKYHRLADRDLLSTEDELIECAHESLTIAGTDTVILDISALPKRFFCFMLKRLLGRSDIPNVVVCYTQPKEYLTSEEHLASNPCTCDHLPGFPVPIDPDEQTLVISVGFEHFNLKAILEKFRGWDRGDFRILMNFPPNGEYFRRQWHVLIEVMGIDAMSHVEVRRRKEIVPALDTELAYLVLERWAHDTNSLLLAPFGPKTHSLAMALCAIKNDFGVYYTQPKVYHPDYTKGIGQSWGYVVKWDGTPCYDRVTSHV
jgi:hypothetical protein